MSDFPSFDTLFRAARDEILVRSRQLSVASVERAGSDANVLVAAGVAAAEEVIGQLITVAAGQFLDSAVGACLDRRVFDRYGLTRKPAATARGSAKFTTTVANPAAFTIPEGTLLQTADGIQYITTIATSFALGSVGPLFISIRSVLAGADQQAEVGTITSLVSAITGSPTDLVVTNDTATAGAVDDESDEALRERARRFFTTARRGTLRALETGALAVAGVRTATAIEVLDQTGRPARLTQLVVTDEFTNVLAELGENPPLYQGQSQQLAKDVFDSLSDVRAAGMFVQVVVAQVILLSVQLQLTFAAGGDPDEVALRARAAVVNFINDKPPGTTFDVAGALDVLRVVTGLAITEDEIASPAGNVVPQPLQVLRTSLELVTAVSVQAGQPLAITINPDAFIRVDTFGRPAT